jgi:hypothetical protein
MNKPQEKHMTPDVLTGEVAAPSTRTLFDPEYSPIRILFRSDDPAKDGTLPFVAEIQSHISDCGDDPTVLIRTTWLDAYKLLAGSIRFGIYPLFDVETAQTRISGYELVRAGLLTADCKVTVTLTDEERRAQRLSDPPTVQEAMDAVMTLYIHALSMEVIETGDAKLAALYCKLVKVWPVA